MPLPYGLVNSMSESSAASVDLCRTSSTPQGGRLETVSAGSDRLTIVFVWVSSAACLVLEQTGAQRVACCLQVQCCFQGTDFTVSVSTARTDVLQITVEQLTDSSQWQGAFSARRKLSLWL